MKLQGNDEEKNEKLLRKLIKKNPKMCQLTLDLDHRSKERALQAKNLKV